MAIKAINLRETKEYESLKDPDYGSEKATKFLIGVLKQEDIVEFLAFSRTCDENTDHKLILQKNREVCLKGLKGIKNYETAEGLVSIGLEGVDDKLLDDLGVVLIKELSETILQHNLMTDIEAKNLKRLSSSKQPA